MKQVALPTLTPPDVRGADSVRRLPESLRFNGGAARFPALQPLVTRRSDRLVEDTNGAVRNKWLDSPRAGMQLSYIERNGALSRLMPLTQSF